MRWFAAKRKSNRGFSRITRIEPGDNKLPRFPRTG